MSLLFHPDFLPELIGEVLSHCTRFELSVLALVNKEWQARIAPRLLAALCLGITHNFTMESVPVMKWRGKESYGKTRATNYKTWFSTQHDAHTYVYLTTPNCTIRVGSRDEPDDDIPSQIYSSWAIATHTTILAREFILRCPLKQKILLQAVMDRHFHGVVLIHPRNDIICCIANYPALYDEFQRVKEIARRRDIPFEFELPLPPKQ